MKSKEELNELQQQYEALKAKCRELTPEELAQVTGGEGHCGVYAGNGMMIHAPQLAFMFGCGQRPVGEVADGQQIRPEIGPLGLDPKKD